MNEALYNKIKELPKENIINLMWDALDIMQSYNGRSRSYCIAVAMGYEPEEQEDGTMMYRTVTKEEVKENTSH